MSKKISAVILISLLSVLGVVVTSTTPTSLSAEVEQAEITTNVAQAPIVAMEKKEVVQGYIFIGDSRFVGMNTVCDIESKENCFVVAKISQGYDWLMSSAISSIENIKSSNPEITNWSLVIGLGINDLSNIDSYLEEYKTLAKTSDLYVVSVNPIEYHSYITNSEIVEFNNALKSLGNCTYIDAYSTLLTNGYSTVDGIHYTNSTYESIFSCISDCLLLE